MYIQAEISLSFDKAGIKNRVQEMNFEHAHLWFITFEFCCGCNLYVAYSSRNIFDDSIFANLADLNPRDTDFR